MSHHVTRVDLIIPTRDGVDLLMNCLRSLMRSTYTDWRLIVFDDGSREPVEAVVRAECPTATTIRSSTNVGLASAVNRSITAGDSELVVLLNNDTEVTQTWLAELVACADRHLEAGSIASKLRLMADRAVLHSAGDTYSVRGMPGNRGAWLVDYGQYDTEGDVFSACGGAALYRRAALDDVRLRDGFVFDERLFMYCEDVDLGWRLQRARWRCVFAPHALVYHALSATGGGALASYFVSRNIWLVLARSVPAGLLDTWRPRIAAYQAGRIARHLCHIREPAARAALRGTAVGVWMALFETQHAAPLPADQRERILRLLDCDVR
jgi:GT2 family glycosyltransferase